MQQRPFTDRTGGRAARAPRVNAVSMIAVAALLYVVPAVFAQDGGSGVQVTPDAERVLVTKDVGDERWAITRNEDDTVTGNVFQRDGSPPSFVWCEPLDGGDDDFGDFFDDLIDDLIGGDDDDDGDAELTYSCYGADACDDNPCTEDEWDFVADVRLPESFFQP